MYCKNFVCIVWLRFTAGRRWRYAFCIILLHSAPQSLSIILHFTHLYSWDAALTEYLNVDMVIINPPPPFFKRRLNNKAPLNKRGFHFYFGVSVFHSFIFLFFPFFSFLSLSSPLLPPLLSFTFPLLLLYFALLFLYFPFLFLCFCFTSLYFSFTFLYFSFLFLCFCFTFLYFSFAFALLLLYFSFGSWFIF